MSEYICTVIIRFFGKELGGKSGSFSSLIGGKPDESADQLLKY